MALPEIDLSTLVPAHCEDPEHASRSSEPGWHNGPLAHVSPRPPEAEPLGLLCGACGREYHRRAAAAAQALELELAELAVALDTPIEELRAMGRTNDELRTLAKIAGRPVPPRGGNVR
jgi:hypothetical protein